MPRDRTPPPISAEDAEEFSQSIGQIGGGLWRQIAWAERQGIPGALGLSTRDWVNQYVGGYVRLSIEERREAVAELTSEGMSTREIGGVLGVGKSTIHDDLSEIGQDEGIAESEAVQIRTEMPPERKQREEAAASRRERAEERSQEMASRLALGNGIDAREGDFRTVLDDLYGTVDAIITDPPYPADFIEEFDALGAVAKKLLKLSGILVVMVGGVHLPEYLERLSRHMKYRWCGAYLTDGPATRIQGRKVGTKWKPLLIYGGERFITQDVFQSQGDDKRFHYWGQSESGMGDIVERLTDPGQLIVDPFMGGGTTGVVCRDLGRRFVGCDIDPKAVATARGRLS